MVAERVSLPRRVLRVIVGPFVRLFNRMRGPVDPWLRSPQRVPLKSFGRGSVHPFSWYFEGESAISVASVDEICAWLLECEYLRDPELFHEADFWQHPATFERLRRGDCEDHALWAWRKLVELGLEAELVSGRWAGTDGKPISHVWVRFRQDGRDYIFEAVSRKRDRMVRPLDDARAEYIPHAGVDGKLRSYGYAGRLIVD
jgi:hypothetical protein